MSVEEDTELRDLISQNLEASGCFAKIRAQLRASIYLALDEDDVFQKKELFPNKKIHSILETVEGKIMFCIVREFLEQFDLDFTISVFESESYMGSNYQYMGRYKLIEDLNMPNIEQESSDPVLLQLIQLCKFDNKSMDSRDTNSRYSKSDCTENICIESSSTTSINESDINKSIASDNSEILESHKTPANDSFLNKGFSPHICDGNITFTLYNNQDDTYDVSKLNLDETPKEEQLIDFDKSLKLDSSNSKSDSEKAKSLIDQTITETEFSPPVVKDSKQSKFDTSFDKIKLSSPKSDKIKVKNNLSSLSDLPPLPMTKSRSNDMLLPSLYSKDFKDKSNLRDVEKLFELEPLDNYEEDFISESEIDLTLTKTDETAKNILETLHKEDTSNKITSATSLSKKFTNSLDQNRHELENSSSSSIMSEGFNSNVDDILNSC